MVNCDFIKTSIIAYLQSETEILSTKRACIVSLPIKVLDGVNVEVYVEEALAGYVVHDGGRALGNIESSGMIVTEKKIDFLSQLARRMGVSFDNGVFRAIATPQTLQNSVFSIAQCCSVAASELIKHGPSTEEERLRTKASIDIRAWAASRNISILTDSKVSGRLRQYTLDFVAQAPGHPIAVSILVPSYGAAVSADRYALQVLDMGDVGYKRLAVLAKPKLWKRAARQIIAKVADGTAEFDDDEGLFGNNIATSLDQLAAAA